MEKMTMQINKKNVLFIILTALTFLLVGCQDNQQIIPLLGSTKGQKGASVAKRFQGSAQKGPTTIESAIELSEKYAKLVEETAALRQKKQDITAENSRLKEQIGQCRSQLKQTQKELAEANDLLIEMRIELNNWKNDILGFRNEMRDADKAQLDALLKILKTLGGEIEAESAQGRITESSVRPQNELSQPRPESTPAIGEPNE
jgi:chromosome segregation ATPase